jgi:hypothetical protein
MCNKQSPISAFIAGGGGGGGSVNTGVLQTLGGGVLSGTLQTITDQSSNQSPLQLSTAQASFAGFAGASTANIVWRANSILTDYTGWHQSDGSYKILTKDAAAIFININDGVNFSAGFSSTGRTTINAAGNWSLGGSFGNAARLHVRGDGTNSIGRFESSAGNSFFIINNSGQSLFGSAGANEPYLVNYNGTSTESGSGQSLRIRQRANTGSTGNTLIQYWADGLFSGTTSGTAISHEFVSSGFLGSGAGNANYRHSTHAYTINNSAAQSGTATGIFLNATETALNGMTHNLMDLQAGGVSKFKVASNGVVSNVAAYQVSSSGYYGVGGGSYIAFPSDGNATLSAWSGGWSLLQFGGTTNAFPAIKRNGAELEAVFANDSGFCNFQAAVGRFTGFNTSAFTNNFALGSNANIKQKLVIEDGSPTAITASALVELKSTTLGFLLPKMTTTDRGNIVSPATGLKLYNTSTNNTDTFDGTNWQSFGKETKITGSLEVNIASGKVINAIEVSSAMGLGFYNAAAIIQPVTGGASATYANVSGTEIKENDTFDGYTIGNVVKALRDLGLLA